MYHFCSFSRSFHTLWQDKMYSQLRKKFSRVNLNIKYKGRKFYDSEGINFFLGKQLLVKNTTVYILCLNRLFNKMLRVLCLSLWNWSRVAFSRDLNLVPINLPIFSLSLSFIAEIFTVANELNSNYISKGFKLLWLVLSIWWNLDRFFSKLIETFLAF